MHIPLGELVAQLVHVDVPARLQVQARQLEPRCIASVDQPWRPGCTAAVATRRHFLLDRGEALHEPGLTRLAHLLRRPLVVYKGGHGRLEPRWGWV